MSAPADSAAAPDRAEQMLARLAELDMAAAERAHERFMAAEEGPASAEAGRTYRTMAHSLRQTLALKAKLEREHEVAARERAAQASRRHSAVAILNADIAQAVRFVVEPSDHRTVLDALERAVAAEALLPGFEACEHSALVERVCARLPLDYDQISAVTQIAVFEGPLWPETVSPYPGMRSARPPRRESG